MPFDAIIYGPFEAKYHRKAVNNSFKKHLVDYLTSELLSQVTIHYDESSGDLQVELRTMGLLFNIFPFGSNPWL